MLEKFLVSLSGLIRPNIGRKSDISNISQEKKDKKCPTFFVSCLIFSCTNTNDNQRKKLNWSDLHQLVSLTLVVDISLIKSYFLNWKMLVIAQKVHLGTQSLYSHNRKNSHKIPRKIFQQLFLSHLGLYLQFQIGSEHIFAAEGNVISHNGSHKGILDVGKKHW